MSETSALVLLSGGQDSAVCLAWALDRFARVETVGFAYGQRHAIELERRDPVREAVAAIRPEWRARLGPDRVLDLAVLGEVSVSALTADLPIEFPPGALPSTFVPGRNLVFLIFAAILARARGLARLVGGMCETDFSGYPDCRDDSLKALQVALNLGMDARLVIDTPLMWLTKADTWAMAEALGGEALVEAVVEETHTCYRGERGPRHPWGHGCAACPACALRAKGWHAWRNRT